MPFKKGQSGNPVGRPKGAKDRSHLPRKTFRAICAWYIEQNAAKIEKALDQAMTSKAPERALMVLLKAEGEHVHLTGAQSSPVVVHWHAPA
jgi:hypothetical protein